DAWQAQSDCKAIETKGGVFLFQDYSTGEDGAMSLNPVSIVFFREVDEQGNPIRPIILDAPGGAELVSDGSMNLSKFRLGKIVKGRLLGDVLIRTPQSTPADQSLRLETRNVQIDERRITTPPREPIRFRYGGAHGQGRDLTIQLRPKTDRDANPKSAESSNPLSGLSSLELLNVDYIEAPLADSAAFPLADAGSDQPASHLRITCSGSLFIDFPKRVATFRDNVDVTRLAAAGPNDQLSAQVLELHLADQSSPKIAAAAADDRSASGNGHGNASMKLKRIVARGEPVIVTAPSSSGSARAQWLQFDVIERRIQLEDRNRVQLQYDGMDITAPHLSYQIPLNSRRIGELDAGGPGRVSGMVGKKEPQPFEATWGRRLEIEPQAELRVISLYENATLSLDEGAAGHFAANRLHLYIKETPRPALTVGGVGVAQANAGDSKFDVHPQRLLAFGEVEFDSPKMGGSTNKLDIHFENAARGESNGQGGGGAVPLTGPSRSPDKKKDERKFSVDGGEIEMRVIVDDARRKMRVDDITVRKGLRVRQIKLAEQDDAPFYMDGEQLQISSVSRDRNQVKLLGQPANMRLGAMSITGNQLFLDQPQQRVWADGAGEIQFPSSRTDATGLTTRITWKKAMVFDGERVQFQEDVEVHGARRTKDGDLLRYVGMSGLVDAWTNRPVDFSQIDSSKQGEQEVQLRALQFAQGVYFENRSTTAQGKPKSFDRVQTRELYINQQTGEVRSQSSGWGATVRFAKDRFLKQPGPPNRVEPADGRLVRRDDPRLVYMHISFQRGLEGNLNDRLVRFFGQVAALYGPVNAWDEELTSESPDSVGERGVELHSDELELADVGVEGNPQLTVTAIGNTTAENPQFMARGHRLSYSEAKDLLILEGNGLYDAHLTVYGDTGAKDKDLVARRIHFWPGTRDFEVAGAKSLNFGAFGGRSDSASPVPLRRQR
ncbi:MAG: hypothetical protein QF805_20150, partial [Pirellulaceae bacterium]|nr:hypothetical protein [Pirellulaceae bacterium]